jgi:hypothetical protein
VLVRGLQMGFPNIEQGNNVNVVMRHDQFSPTSGAV